MEIKKEIRLARAIAVKCARFHRELAAVCSPWPFNNPRRLIEADSIRLVMPLSGTLHYRRFREHHAIRLQRRLSVAREVLAYPYQGNA